MTAPVVLHVTRPYANAEDYLRHEAWTMDARSMLLIGEAPLPADTSIVFDVALGDDSRPIRAEARVLESIAPSGERPGGLRVRFKRYGASTKAFIDRALALAANATAPQPAPETSAAAPVKANAAPVEAPPEARDARLSALRERALELSEPAAPAERDGLLARLRQRGEDEDVTARRNAQSS